MRIRRWSRLTAGLGLLLSCTREYELLRRSPSGEGGSAGGGGVSLGTGGGGGAGITLAGSSGTATVGTAGAAIIGGESSGGATRGDLPTGGTGSAEPCANHFDCNDAKVCRERQCVACPDTPTTCVGPCEAGFQPRGATYNGCRVCECAPVSECESTADCPAEEECYPGAQCEPGCSEPGCCTGNRCSAPGCAGTAIPHCLAAGCSGGALCLAACSAVTCACDGTEWRCAESPGEGGAPSESCPQACVSP
jgi:hypothetical protein